jgi:sigma-B regulation protein RsbU (phosphoserine phosphatase)
VLYTDGLTDSESTQGRNFGSDRLTQTLEQNAAKSSREICSTVLDEVKGFSKKGAGLDDMTLIVLKRI